MSLYETKIVVPDNANARLVVLDSINGPWYSRQYFTEQPYDLDFDSRGRLYVLYPFINDIIRFDNANLDNPQPLGHNYDTMIAVAVDRTNNLIYFANSGNLYKAALGNTASTLMTISPISTIRGIDVAPDGHAVHPGTERGRRQCCVPI